MATFKGKLKSPVTRIGVFNTTVEARDNFEARRILESQHSDCTILQMTKIGD
jgi:hypothetical protein